MQQNYDKNVIILRFASSHRRAIIDSRSRKPSTKEIFTVPLLICALFFAALFTFEIAWYYAGVAEQEQEVDRYEHVEHPRRPTSDRYLDVLG